MKKLLPIFVLFGFQMGHAQFFKKYFFYEGEIGGITSFFVKDADGDTKVVTVGGLSFRGGLGIHNEDNSLSLGLNSGIEGNFKHDTGILPVYINSRVMLGDDTNKVILAFGYGRSFQMGPENLHGYLRKYTIGFANITDRNNMQTFFIEANNHGFNFPDDGLAAKTLNFGYTYTFL
ncbi:hypothetical protein [Flavobacterium wongokense]|uniref:hypothetical protein n=1 Tax=Flavobacterium wongokense TaxID=2910674 RepID=UPI001F280A1D|nr:hypothetical protein [Flavobacterium sp. WG47]MCF6131408.1 hypothetical protein [Flavobacterium sp. WG47]